MEAPLAASAKDQVRKQRNATKCLSNPTVIMSLCSAPSLSRKAGTQSVQPAERCARLHAPRCSATLTNDLRDAVNQEHQQPVS